MRTSGPYMDDSKPQNPAQRSVLRDRKDDSSCSAAAAMAVICRRSAAAAAGFLARRIASAQTLRPFGASAAAVELDFESDWEEDYRFSNRSPASPLATAATAKWGELEGRGVQWVFMGTPGARKHLYASRVAQLLDVPYISMGNLVRQELHPHSSLYIKYSFLITNHELDLNYGEAVNVASAINYGWKSPLSFSSRRFRRARNGGVDERCLMSRDECKQDGKATLIANAVNEGKLVPEDVIFGLLSKRLEEGYCRGETGFVLDGIPRTCIQAEILDQIAVIDLVVNLKCREDCLVKKHLGKDICAHCGRSIDAHNSDLNSLNPCLATRSHSEINSSCNMDQNRLEKLRTYAEQNKQLEEYYGKQNKLLNFYVDGRLGETWQGLLAALHLQQLDVASLSQKLTV
ncbi:Adenylate kinase, chloroplastic [Apostasia shenzhenica]|uniref:adenylate kinase n=1 Tax=Apostasia shenzhenica TaxID=1088818 RepID=A0A2I0AGW0_9ASPA|nr:Adenylate kinase, chloroplastic [Apostasia shenzhenica]